MPPITKLRAYAIGAMSKATGVKIETIRYYERIGLMPQPDRTAGGSRQYSHLQLQRLSFIKKSRDLGFNLDEIRLLLQMADQHEFTCGEVHELTIGHLASVRKKIADLRRLETVLATMAAQCSQGSVPECPILETLFDAENPLEITASAR